MGVAGCRGDDQGPWESLPVPLLPINPARSQTHPRPGAAAREPSRTRCGSFGKVAAGTEGTWEAFQGARQGCRGGSGGAAVLSPDERVGCSAGNHCRSAAEGNPLPRSRSQNTLRRGKGRVDGLEITCTNTQP